jgi:hypothetical protein
VSCKGFDRVVLRRYYVPGILSLGKLVHLKEAFALLLKSQNSCKWVVGRLTHGAPYVEFSEDSISVPDVLEVKGFVFFGNRVLYVRLLVTVSSYLSDTTGEDVCVYDFPVIITYHNLRKLSLLYSEGFRWFSNQQTAECGRPHQLFASFTQNWNFRNQ